MYKLFLVKYLSEIGLNCDDCVRTHSVQANVYAVDETHAQVLIRQFDPNSKIQIQSIEDNGVSRYKCPHVFIASFPIVYEGYFGDSPLYHSPQYSRLTTLSK